MHARSFDETRGSEVKFASAPTTAHWTSESSSSTAAMSGSSARVSVSSRSLSAAKRRTEVHFDLSDCTRNESERCSGYFKISFLASWTIGPRHSSSERTSGTRPRGSWARPRPRATLRKIDLSGVSRKAASASLALGSRMMSGSSMFVSFARIACASSAVISGRSSSCAAGESASSSGAGAL